MSIYCIPADVLSEVGLTAFSTGAPPTSTDVQGWIDEAEDELINTAITAGITMPPALYSNGTPTSNSPVGGRTVRGWVRDYVGAKFVNARARAEGAHIDPVGESRMKIWEQRLIEINADPPYYSGVLSGGAVSALALPLRSNVTDPAPAPTTNAQAPNNIFTLNTNDPTSIW